MKKTACCILALALALAPCASPLAEEEWLLHESVLGYTLRYPASLLEVFGVPMEEAGFDYEVFRPIEPVPGVEMTVSRVGIADLSALTEGALPALLPSAYAWRRLEADEPPVGEWETAMPVSYALLGSADGKAAAEAFLLDAPDGEPDYLVLARFPAADTDRQYLFEEIMETMAFPPRGARAGSFSLKYQRTGPDLAVREILVDEEADPLWLYADSAVTGLVLEAVLWDDSTFTVAGAEALYSADRFSPGEALCIRAYLPDLLPTLRVRAVNARGQTETWYLSDSLMDGSLLLLSEADVSF